MKTLLMLALFAISLSSFAQTLTLNVRELTNANPQDEKRIERALELIEEVINTEDFRERILSMKYQLGRKVYNGYSQTSLTPTQILDSILKASENFAGGSEGVLDLYMDMYEEESSTIGFTNPNDKFFHMNRYHHKNYSSAKAAGNIFHEWLHKINHGHSKRDNRQRPHSVPYKLGRLISEMAAEIESAGDPILKNFMLESLDADHSNCDKH